MKSFESEALIELKRIEAHFECLKNTEWTIGDNDNISYGIWHTKDGEGGYYLGNFRDIDDLREQIDWVLRECPEPIMGDVWTRTFFTAARHELRLSDPLVEIPLLEHSECALGVDLNAKIKGEPQKWE